MKFFYGCPNAEEAKIIYRKLAKCFHPDKGGSTELMTELQKQYESWDQVEPQSFDVNFRTYAPSNGGPFRSMNQQFYNFNRDISQDLEKERIHAQLVRDLRQKINSLEIRNNGLQSQIETREYQWSIDSGDKKELKQINDELQIMISHLRDEIEILNKTPKSFLQNIKDIIFKEADAK